MDILKSIYTIKAVMIIHISAGFFYNTSSKRFVTILTKMYCICCGTFIIIIGTTLLLNTGFFRPLHVKIQYFIYVINFFVSLFFSKHFEDIIDKIKNINDDLKVNDKVPISGVLFYGSIFLRFSTHILFGFRNNMRSKVSLTLDIVVTISHLTRIVIFEMLWRRMTLISKYFDRELRRCRIEDGEGNLRDTLKKCMNMYRNTLDIYAGDVSMKLLIFVTVTTIIPKLLEVTYSSFMHGTIFGFKVIILETIVDFVVSLSPAVLAEMVSTEVDNMKLTVVKLLLVCKATDARDAVTDAMMVFKQHPFKYSVGRLFTLNMSLILTLINLLTTYVIALVQFCHFNE